MKVLVVDDDRRLQILLMRLLSENNFQIYTANNADEMQRQLYRNIFDIYILDINLPDKNGLEICRSLRERGDSTPIIMLSARSEDVDLITGLEFGADDYLTKPFNSKELVARMQSILRRTKNVDLETELSDFVFEFHGFVLDRRKETLFYNNNIVSISATQFKLLTILLLQKGIPVSRNQLSKKLYNREHPPYSRDIDMLVSHLRKKMDEISETKGLIRTIRGIGYTIVL